MGSTVLRRIFAPMAGRLKRLRRGKTYDVYARYQYLHLSEREKPEKVLNMMTPAETLYLGNYVDGA